MHCLRSSGASKPSAFILYLLTIPALEMEPQKLRARPAKTQVYLKITALGYCLAGVSVCVHVYTFVISGRLMFSRMQWPGEMVFLLMKAEIPV